MESYENLRLERKDKMRKQSFWDRLFRKEGGISEENLDFLEERYTKTNDSIAESPNDSISSQEPKENLISLDDLLLEVKDKNSPNKLNKMESQTTSLNIKEKEAMLELDWTTKEIPFKVVCLVFVAMFITLSLFVPKVYIRNNIYYTSRNLIQLQAQLDSLNEENKHIKKQLEDIKFKNLTHELDF